MDPNEPAGAPPVVPPVEAAQAAAPTTAAVADSAPVVVVPVAVGVGVGAWCVDAVGRVCQIAKIDDEGVATVAVDNVLGFGERKVAELRVALAKELPPHVQDRAGYQ